MSNAAAPTHPDLKDTLEEVRASVAACGARKGIRGAIQQAILGFLEAFLALLADFRAGKLAPVAPVAEEAAGDVGGAVACPSLPPAGSRPTPAASLPTRGECEDAPRCFPARTAATADGLLADPPIAAGRFDPATRGNTAGAGMTGNVSRTAEGANGAGGAAVRGPERRSPALALRPRRFGTATCAPRAAVAAAAGDARHSPGFPALQDADAKNRVFGAREFVGALVPG